MPTITIEHVIGVVVAAVVAGVTAYFQAKKTTNGITGHISDHLKSSNGDSGTTLRVAVDEIRENVSLVLGGQARMDERLLQTERRIEDHLDAQDAQIEEQGEQIRGVSARVTVLEKWKETA